MTREEILAAVRGSGHPTLNEVRAVVLETDGSLSVIASAGGVESLPEVQDDSRQQTL